MLHLLGPQRQEPNLVEVLDGLGVSGPLVAFTAGWRHDEDELGPLQSAVGEVTHLPLYRWFDEIPDLAPDVARLYKERQARIMRFKDLYRLRMAAGLDTVRALVRLGSKDQDLIEAQVQSASEVVRSIDREALAAVDAVRAEYVQLHERFAVPQIAARRDAVVEACRGAGAILVAGGHVAVLRNRLLFFGAEHPLAEALRRGVPVLAWGAGAMVMTRRIVLFYDDAPEGPADAEILDHGLGLAPGVVALPHARERLRLEDGARVAALARRFGPDACIALEKGAWISHTPGGWRSRGEPGTASLLLETGALAPVPEATP